jgi:hypothetical protein
MNFRNKHDVVKKVAVVRRRIEEQSSHTTTSVSNSGTDITSLASYLSTSSSIIMCCSENGGNNNYNNKKQKQKQQKQKHKIITPRRRELKLQQQECLTALINIQNNIINIKREYNKAIILLEKENDIKYKIRQYYQRSQLRNNGRYCFGISVVGGISLIKEKINHERCYQLKQKAHTLINDANIQLKIVYSIIINYKSETLRRHNNNRNDLLPPQYNNNNNNNNAMEHIGNGLLPPEINDNSSSSNNNNNGNSNIASLGQAICERQIKLLTIVIEQMIQDHDTTLHTNI